jgi:hypothetical protein
MLDKLIIYIVWWYKTVYHVLSVAWTNRITTRRYCHSQWYWFTQQTRPDTNIVPPHYVYNGYIFYFFWNLKNWKINTVKHGYKLNIIRYNLTNLLVLQQNKANRQKYYQRGKNNQPTQSRDTTYTVITRFKNKKTVHIAMFVILHVITAD